MLGGSANLASTAVSPMFCGFSPRGGSPRPCFQNYLKHFCFTIVVLQLCGTICFCNHMLQDVLTVVEAQGVSSVVKSPRSPNRCKVQEVVIVVKTQEVLTDVKSKKC